MPASHSIELHFPLPASLSRDQVIQHLQAYEPLITPHPYLQRFDKRPVDPADLAGDAFFAAVGDSDNNNDRPDKPDGWGAASYVVVERVPIVPLLGITKDVRIPATFQSIPTGVRCRADAQAGVTVWSTYEVVRRDLGAEFERAGRACTDGVGRDGADRDVLDVAVADGGLCYDRAGSGHGGGGGTGEWELVERARVECSAILRPFVVRSFEVAHRDLCRRVIDDLVRKTDGDGDGDGERLALVGETPVAAHASVVVA